AWFPAGFGMTTTTNSRAMLPYALATNISIGPDLVPTNSTLTFTASFYAASRLYFAEETKPLFIGAQQIEWHIPQGEFYIAGAQSLQFVRQQEDDDLASYRTNLVDPSVADRISNDEFYRNAGPVAATPIYISPDTNNGSARLAMQVQLNPVDYRPHFPYV